MRGTKVRMYLCKYARMSVRTRVPLYVCMYNGDFRRFYIHEIGHELGIIGGHTYDWAKFSRDTGASHQLLSEMGAVCGEGAV